MAALTASLSPSRPPEQEQPELNAQPISVKAAANPRLLIVWTWDAGSVPLSFRSAASAQDLAGPMFTSVGIYFPGTIIRKTLPLISKALAIKSDPVNG